MRITHAFEEAERAAGESLSPWTAQGFALIAFSALPRDAPDLKARLELQVAICAEAIRGCDAAEAQSERLEGALRALDSALSRTEANFRRSVEGKPVRDMAENLAENVSASRNARALLAESTPE